MLNIFLFSPVLSTSLTLLHLFVIFLRRFPFSTSSLATGFSISLKCLLSLSSFSEEMFNKTNASWDAANIHSEVCEWLTEHQTLIEYYVIIENNFFFKILLLISCNLTGLVNQMLICERAESHYYCKSWDLYCFWLFTQLMTKLNAWLLSFEYN